MAEKVCANCGAEVPAAAIFCTQCGSRDLHEAPSPPRSEDPPPPPASAPDAPTVPVTDTQETPSYAAPFGEEAARRPEPADAPTMAETSVVDDPTSVYAAPPPPTAPVPATPTWDQPTAAQPPAPTPAPPPTQIQSPTPTPAPPRTGTPTPAPTADRGGRLGAALVAIGGAAAIVGAFLEWMKITPDWADAVSLSGWTLTDDAKVVVVVGAIVVVAAVVVLGGSLRGPMRVLAAVGGIVLLGLGAYDTYDILRELPDALAAAGVSGAEIAAPQIGLVLVLVGGALALLGALAMTRPREPAVAPDPHGAPGPRPATAGGPYPGSVSSPPAGGYAPPSAGAEPYGGTTGGYGTPPGGYGPPSASNPPPTAPFGREWS